MWGQFILINFHFALNVVAALIFFMVSWLYFDAWFEHRALKNTCKIAGFALLALSFLIQAAIIDSSTLGTAFLPGKYIETVSLVLRVLGYIGVAAGLLLDPLPIIPKTKGITMTDMKGIFLPMSFSKVFALPFLLSMSSLTVIVPILAAFVGFLNIRRATLGLENHLKPIGWGMYIIALYELCLFALRIVGIKNVFWYNILKPYGIVWIASNALLFIGIFLIGSWVFKYLLKRIQSQIFIIYSCSVLVIFLTITVTFTWLLLHNIESEALNQLETDTKVLNFAVESKKAETLSDALALAQSPQLSQFLVSGNQKEAESLSEAYLLSKNLNSVVILNSEGIVVAKGEDREHNGISMSGDSLVKKGLEGKNVSSIISRNGVFAPEINISAVAAIKSGDKIIGTVLLDRRIDNAFVDGVKDATGLEVSLYGNNRLSATTLVALDNNARANGIIEDTAQIKKEVLEKGKFFQTSTVILNRQYLASYMPVRNADSEILGMLFVGRPEVAILASALRSIQATFIIANILLLFSIFPSYLISRYISRQLE